MSYWSFREKGKIHEVGALRTTRGEKVKNLLFQWVCAKHFQIQQPIQSPAHSSHSSEQKAGLRISQHILQVQALIISQTEIQLQSLSLAGRVCLIFYYSSAMRINKLDTTQENKGIMRLLQARVIFFKKVQITAQEHDSFSIEWQTQWMKRSQNDLIWTTMIQNISQKLIQMA